MGGQGSALLSTSPATLALKVDIASNFGAPSQPRQQFRRSWPTSPATLSLPANFRQQIRRSQSHSPATSALGQPCQQLRRSGQPRRQLRYSRSTWPATSALPVNLRQQLRRSRSTSPATSQFAVSAATATTSIRNDAHEAVVPFSPECACPRKCVSMKNRGNLRRCTMDEASRVSQGLQSTKRVRDLVCRTHAATNDRWKFGNSPHDQCPGAALTPVNPCRNRPCPQEGSYQEEKST